MLKVSNNGNLCGKMHELIPENKVGDFEIKYKIATKENVAFEKMRSAIHGDYGGYGYHDFEPGTYTTLRHYNSTIMSDTPMEVRTCDDVVENANGNVLIVGLGLGIVLLKIQQLKTIYSITLIEKHHEVIDLVAKYLPLKPFIKIVEEDIFDWLPKRNSKFDTIYFDIWSDICGDNYKQMKELHQKFRKFLNKKSNSSSWMGSWSCDFCKDRYFQNE